MFVLALLTALLAETKPRTREAAAPANRLSLFPPQWPLPTSPLFLASLIARRLSVSFYSFHFHTRQVTWQEHTSLPTNLEKKKKKGHIGSDVLAESTTTT